MRAAQVRCPRCGAPMADVDADIDLRLCVLLPAAETRTSGNCANGHALTVRVTDKALSVEAARP